MSARTDSQHDWKSSLQAPASFKHKPLTISGCHYLVWNVEDGLTRLKDPIIKVLALLMVSIDPELFETETGAHY